MAEQDLSRPYVGYRSAGRRPESQQDRTASANAPLSALRGYVAGTLGLPGDIEGLGRMLIPGVSEQSYLPGSEYFRKVLPMRELEQTPIGSAFTEAGGLAGGAGLITAGKVVGKGGKAGARYAGEQLNRAILDSSGPLARLVPEAAKPMYVVKPKGGNWLAAQPERITGPLRNSRIEEADYNQFVRDQADLGTGYQDWLKGKVDQNREFAFIPAIDTANMFLRETKQPLIPIDPVNSWIDKTLKSYVRNEMATPDDPLRAMAEQWAAKKPELLAQADAKLKALNAKTQKLMAERGVPEEFLTRHRQDVIAAEKARDLIEARQALHARMPQGGRWEPEELAGKRSGAGFPAKGMGVSEEAKNWEQISDEAIGVGSAGKRFGSGYGGQVLEDNPWLAKVPPETPTYTGYGLNELGFEHLGDELRNALNPNSGLPADLLLKYSDLPKKTVPDIVNQVADIDAWRATQKAEADLAKANNAAVVTVKEYPEQGLAWKQIKGRNPDEFEQSISGLEPKAWDEAVKKFRIERETELKDALKYEGDIMKHCVGGYCESVASGQTKIYSLRDAKGKPHVTIEVESQKNASVNDFKAAGIDYKSVMDEAKRRMGLTPETEAQLTRNWDGVQREKFQNELYKHVDDIYNEQVGELPQKILQIKGVENKKPEAEYMPQIQDFVKSGNWSEVKDLKNAGLIRADAIRGAGWDNIGLDQKYLTEQEYDDLLLKNLQPPAQGMAHGGPVSLNELAARYDKGGAVKAGIKKIISLFDDGEEALTAAQRAEAGRKAAELIKAQEQVKASEALGQLMERGTKRTTTTQSDRTRVGGGNIGGAAFPAISQADPAYAGKVWGVMDEGTAARLKNLTSPDTAWTTMLGAANQLKSNPIVFDKLKRGFLDSMKKGNLSDDLAGRINQNLALTFGEGADIRNPKIWREADTFEKRAALADVMMGQGIAPGKGGVALGGEKSGKGVIFKPTDILKRETEPSLLHSEYGGGVPTYAAGPRLFKIGKESEYRPDLHPGFPTLLRGEDLGVNMMPTPTEVYLPDWHAKFKKANPDRAPGYYDLSLGVKGEGLPSQEINDAYIRHLMREGYAEGGSVQSQAATYDPSLIDEIVSSIDEPTGYAEGGEVRASEKDFGENPENLRFYKYAMKQAMPNKEDSMSNTGAGARARVGDGDLNVGIDMNRMTQGQQDQLMKTLAANYNVNLGDVNMNARVEKPLDAKDVYVGMINGSIPLGVGRAMLGVQGIKTPYGSDVLGYNVGYSGKVGPGRLSANVNMPKRGSKSAQVQYQIPFAEGGSVSAYDADLVDAIANQFM
jgi:hypothetical protein